jgi:hypothetical protein
MRRLVCTTCATKDYYTSQHPGDAAMGMKFRRVEIPHVKKPPGLCLTINGKDEPELKTLVCDGCSQPIPDGSPAVAITQWRGGEMGDWEREYSQ